MADTNTDISADTSADAEDALPKATIRKFLQINHYLRRYTRQITEVGLRPRQFVVLHFLHESGPATVGQVQEYLYRSPSTASTTISKLAEAGFVTRKRSHTDNRVVIVELTAAGRDAVASIPLGGTLLLRRRLHTLARGRLERIDQALADIMELMEIEDDEG